MSFYSPMNYELFKYSYNVKVLRYNQSNWLIKKLGPIGTGWEYHLQKVWFKSESDRMMFALKFG